MSKRKRPTTDDILYSSSPAPVKRGVRVSHSVATTPEILELRALAEHVTADLVPAAVVQAKARKLFDRHLETLDDIASGTATTMVATKDGLAEVEPSAGERVRAIGVLGQYSASTGVAPEVVRSKLLATIDTIRSILPSDQADAVLSAIRPIWE